MNMITSKATTHAAFSHLFRSDTHVNVGIPEHIQCCCNASSITYCFSEEILASPYTYGSQISVMTALNVGRKTLTAMVMPREGLKEHIIKPIHQSEQEKILCWVLRHRRQVRAA